MKRSHMQSSTSRLYRCASYFLALLLVAALAGCASTSQPGKSSQRSSQKSKAFSADGEKITLEELDALTHGYADRYMSYVVSACDSIAKDNPSAEQRRLANQVKLIQVSSTFDIVTNADPFTQLLDLTLVVTLQSQKWIDEDQAEDWFGERAQPLIVAMRRAREDIWKVAGRVMKPDQLEVLDYLIWDFRQKNPEVQLVSFVRFDDFAASRGKSVVADVKTGSGLLAPVDEAKKAVDEVRLLTERAFYYGKRMPFLMNWQVQDAVDGAVGNPQIKGVTDSVTKNTERITALAERMPDEIAKEHERVVRDVQRMNPLIQTALTNYRGAVGDTDRLVESVKEVTETADTLLHTLQATSLSVNSTIESVDKAFLAPGKGQPKPKNEKPFDIGEYAQTALAVTSALKEANQLVSNGTGFLGSPQFEQPLQKVSMIAAERMDQARFMGVKLIDAAFWRGAALIVLFFVLLTLYRLFASLILPRLTGKARA
jgi:hypothetical protein